MRIIDRRPNPQGKSLPNRQRFLARARAQVRQAVADSVAERRVADVGSSERVRIRIDGTAEPDFRRAPGGDHDHVLPGTGTINRGDRIPKPQSGGGGGGSGRGAGGGSGEDAFEFTLTRQEFLEFFFDDLELPHLARTLLGEASLSKPRRAGYTVSGQPTALDVRRTMRNSLARRIALKRPDNARIDALRAEIEAAEDAEDGERTTAAHEALRQALRRVSAIPYVDPVDVRYSRFERVPEPATEAVAFMLMDVSGSMTDTMKDLAKRFFMLLHLFLERQYERVHIVFIRHTEHAKEVDEETFFRSRETGGTVVSSALHEMLRIQEERYPVHSYNIYVAQASDGDNDPSDNRTVAALLRNRVLPVVRYFAYVETRPESGSFFHQAPSFERKSNLWRVYEEAARGDAAARLAMRTLTEARDVWGVFADLFRKSGAVST